MREDSQCQIIRQALEAGRVLTWLDIYRLAGCINHKGRISDLRKQGMNIPRDHCVLIKSQRGWKRIGIYYDSNQMDYEEAFRRLDHQDSKPLLPPKTSSKPRKPPNKALSRDSDTGRFKPANNPLTKEIAVRARVLYREGATLRQIYQEFPDTSQWQIYRDLYRQGLLRHRGQHKDSERQLAFSELGSSNE